MTTKEIVLRRLLEADGKFVSGEKLSDEAKVSRMAICKAVKSLQEGGYQIEGRRHYGYAMNPGADILSKATLEAELKGSDVTVYYLDETESTNRDAKVLAMDGAATPYLITTSSQSGGRGRLGRKFESPSGGVYFSLVLSGSQIASPDLVTISAAYALAVALERLTGVETAIKWVNDIYIRGKKVSGILTEGIVNMEEGGLDKVVIGCGINLKTRTEDLSPEIQKVATSFYPDGKSEVTRAQVIGECVKEIIRTQSIDFLDGYRRKCFVPGHAVTVLRAGTSREAEALRIDDLGHLVVRYEDGTEEALSSGEVSLKVQPFTH
ncbi:MAG: biotin--[acetyl-CoA-carboxylase] ligase [Spirochaetales bacterium]|nr:biotin--[acetyl-CoA-carboxylase] ligase [Candidatus Physcosoma equi]